MDHQLTTGIVSPAAQTNPISTTFAVLGGCIAGVLFIPIIALFVLLILPAAVIKRLFRLNSSSQEGNSKNPGRARLIRTAQATQD
ncbi:MAG: hypothetical protein QNJ40_20560 [Xanthomonadales bacterium]|nr:hypothetical protein [Xanthomonadales bacterium]